MTNLKELYNINDEQLMNISALAAKIELEEPDTTHAFRAIQKIEDKTARELCLILYFVKKFGSA